MKTRQRKTISHCGRTSRILVEVSASIADRKHVAETQATLAKASTNLETLRKHFNYIQKECYGLTSARLCWVAIGWHGVGCRLWDTRQGLKMNCV